MKVHSYVILCLLIFSLPLALEAKKGGEASSHNSHEFDLSSLLSHHLMDSVIWEWNLGGVKVYEGDERFIDRPFLRSYAFRDQAGRLYKYSGGIPLHLTRRVVQMFIVGGILVLLVILAARRIAKNPYRITGRFSNIMETLYSWCRRDIVEPSMGHHGKSYSSYIASLFFFILFLNIAGLFPPIGEGIEKVWHHVSVTVDDAPSSREEYGHGSTESPLLALWPGITVTGDLSVTFSLAFITAFMIWVTGFRYQGIAYFWRVVPAGVPLPLYPILWLLEFIVGPLAKGFALTIRLLANMTAGHVMILALLGFIFQSAGLWFGGVASAIGAAGIGMASIAGTVAIYFLEIMVAFLQAFIFTLLTSLFIGSAMHRH